ncbi:MAG: 50S ribosomal protein L25 [Candidatus Altiarchaeales archaeon]|nr:MAG: 50S ribosomal protein L25 [Candidatus Altiarchaeales archaeon]
MKYLEVNAYTREEKGKNKVKKLRAQNFIPAILYGGEPKLIKLTIADVDRLYNMRHENFLVHLNIDEKEKKDAFLKSIQYDPITNKIIHLDFVELIEGKTISIKIPLELKGTPEGVKKGGIVEHFIWDISIECLPRNIPEHIEADISHLEIGDSLHIQDLKVPEGIKILDRPDQVILTIGLPAGVGAEEEVAAEEAEAVEEAAEAEAVPEAEKKEKEKEEFKEEKKKE